MRYFFRHFTAVFLVFVIAVSNVYRIYGYEEKPELALNALSACLMDADTGRILYGKDENRARAMASTTKIMTLIVILENANLNDVVTISQLAARQPDVQLNVNTGEQYVLGDLLYSLMLESHNDVAVALAEHVGGSVGGFAEMMNKKAEELGLSDTYFITPNGLDAVDENGSHHTTASDMAHIASYAIKNEKFIEITNTRSYTFSEINGKRSFTVNNKNRFLDMMEGANGVKTGFTGEAGYCFVGALKVDGRSFVTVVLGSGWPPNRTYKWKDTRTLMQFGKDNFFEEVIFDESFEKNVKVKDGLKDEVRLSASGYVSMLISKYDEVRVYYEILDEIKAPVKCGDNAGHIYISVNGEVVEVIDIKTCENIEKRDYLFYVKQIVKLYTNFLNFGSFA